MTVPRLLIAHGLGLILVLALGCNILRGDENDEPDYAYGFVAGVVLVEVTSVQGGTVNFVCRTVKVSRCHEFDRLDVDGHNNDIAVRILTKIDRNDPCDSGATIENFRVTVKVVPGQEYRFRFHRGPGASVDTTFMVP